MIADTFSGETVASIVVKFGFAKSKSEARRLIAQGGVTIGSIKVSDPGAKLLLDIDNPRRFYIMER